MIFPQELYFLWLIVVGLALALFFFTALVGRLWCGWACPQTVFTDVYAAAARGASRAGAARARPRASRAGGRRDARACCCSRRSSSASTWSATSARPTSCSPALVARQRLGPARSASSLAATALTYLDFALVRQTFCKYLCPYARFQSVLFDRDTLVVAYDARRGEPRGKRGTAARATASTAASASPSARPGIDIRQGLQLECIACTQCIDACDGVMERLGARRRA